MDLSALKNNSGLSFYNGTTAIPGTTAFAGSNVPAIQTDASQNYVLGANTGTGLSTYDAAAAQKAAQAAAIKQSTTGLINNIRGMYDAIYGDVQAAGADKARQVNENYTQDERSLTNQFNDAFPSIGTSYAGRGAYDSSYRMDAEGRARNAFNDTLGQRARSRDTDLGAVGQFNAQQQAKIQGEKGGLDSIANQIGSLEDVNELTSLQNQLSARMQELQSSRAGLQTQASYLDTLNQTVPAGNRIAGLQESLANVLRSQVPVALKRAIGAQIIQNGGIPQAQAASLVNDFNLQLNQAEEQRAPVA